MDTSENNEVAAAGQPVEIVRRLEQHYGCGCSTTRIESLRYPAAGQQPGCQGHRARLVRSVETLEFREEY